MFRIKISEEYLLGLQRTEAVNYGKGSWFIYKNSSEAAIVGTGHLKLMCVPCSQVTVSTQCLSCIFDFLQGHR